MLKPLLGPCDSYQLEPFAYEWAWTMARARAAAATDPVARARVLALRWGGRVMIEWRG